MLVPEHLPRAAEAGLHLVDAEERPVAAAELLRTFEVAGRREGDALALDRLDEEKRNVLALKLVLERGQVAEGHAVEAGQQRLEAARELGVAVRRKRAERQPVEAVLSRNDARPLRRGAPELERSLDRFGAGARELDAGDAAAGALHELLGEQSRKERGAELHRAGRLELERLDERRPNGAVVAADVEHAEAAEHVEEPVPVRVPEVLPFGTHPRAVEADRAQDARELRIDRARPEVEVVARARLEEIPEGERRHPPESSRNSGVPGVSGRRPGLRRPVHEVRQPLRQRREDLGLLRGGQLAGGDSSVELLHRGSLECGDEAGGRLALVGCDRCKGLAGAQLRHQGRLADAEVGRGRREVAATGETTTARTVVTTVAAAGDEE